MSWKTETVKYKTLFNLESNERAENAQIVNGNPSGIVDFIRTKRKWAVSLYDVMLANTWFPSEANMSDDIAPFKRLDKDVKEAFLKILSQLIMNDSIQTDQLVENIKPYITDPIVGQCLTRQAFEESLHSKSYAVIAETILEPDEVERVYYYQNEDKELMKKDKAIEEMYKAIGKVREEVPLKDFMMALAANNILENNIFYGGFNPIWSLGKQLRGSALMISFIERDEFTHVTLFKNIYRDVASYFFGSAQDVPGEIKQDIRNLIDYMTGVEINWTLYVTKNMLGYTKQSVEKYIKYKANQICNNLQLERLYPEIEDGGVLKTNIEDVYTLRNGKTKTNFFEKKVADYAKGSVEIDF